MTLASPDRRSPGRAALSSSDTTALVGTGPAPGPATRGPASGPARGPAPGTAAAPAGRLAAAGDPGHDAPALLRRYRAYARLGDFVAATLAGGGAFAIRFGPDHLDSPYVRFYVAFTLALPALWVAVVTTQRGYEPRFLGTGPEEYHRVIRSAFVLFTGIAVTSYALRSEVARGYVLLAVPGTVVVTLVSRHLLRGWLHRLRARGLGLQRVLVVGRGDGVVALVEQFQREPQHGLVAVGACVTSSEISVSHLHGVPVLGGPETVLDAVDTAAAHVVAVVSHPDLSGQVLRRLAWALEDREVELVVSPGIVEVAGPRLSIRPVAGLSLLHLERPATRGGRQLVKLVFDGAVGGTLLLLAAPVLGVIALAVAATSRGPVLFRQTRIGIDGRPFTMLKFRTMVVDAEQRLAELAAHDEGNGMLFKIRRDPRVTRVGAVLRRYSLDELPQLINVVVGDMSLVGPRPPLPHEVAAYSDDAARRLRLRPGMTGLWQVSGRSDLTWEESLRLDLRYVDNWSMALDLSILWRTWRAVLRGSGAY